MRISDWSSDVCSSDLPAPVLGRQQRLEGRRGVGELLRRRDQPGNDDHAALDIILGRIDAVERDHPARLEVDDRETARRGVTAQPRLVVPGRQAGGLKLAETGRASCWESVWKDV